MNKPDPDFWKGKNIFITGITGFVGSWMAEKLVNDYHANVFGFVRRVSVPNISNIKHILDKVTLIRGDLNDQTSLNEALIESGAEIIFHLAAQSYVAESFKSASHTMTNNIAGTVNLLEACRKFDKNIDSIHFAGSSEEYGLVVADDGHYRSLLEKYKIVFPPPRFGLDGKAVSEIPIKETSPLRPMSPYAVSKVACEGFCLNYYRAYGLPVKVTRAFNHEGPRRGEEFVTTTVAKFVAEAIKNGRREAPLGNMDAIRDFTDVRDIVNGYMLMVERSTPSDVINLCSGKGRDIKDLLELAISIGKQKFGLKSNLTYKQDLAKMRPSDVPILVGDNSKAKKVLGWEPTIPFEKTMEDMIAWQLQNV